MFPYCDADLPSRIELFLCSLELETITASVQQTRRTLRNFMYEQVHNLIFFNLSNVLEASRLNSSALACTCCPKTQCFLISHINMPNLTPRCEVYHLAVVLL